MKRVRYVGDEPVVLPTLNVEVSKGDELEVDDDFANAHFESVAVPKLKITKEGA